MSAAATLIAASPAATARLIEGVAAAHGRKPERRPVVERLGEALGEEFAERLVGMLSKDALDRLDAGLTPEFTERLAALAREAA